MSIRAAELIARVSTEGVDSASAKLAVMGGVVKATEGVFSGLSRGFGNITFGLHNLGTAGTIGWDAIRQGAVQAGASLWKIIGIASLVGAAVAVSIGVISVKAAGDYQAALTRLYTTAGESQKNLGMVGAGMLSMSTDVGTGAQTLAQAMYFVESGGFRAQRGLDVLRIAAMGAKAENSDLNLVVKTLVSTLNAYTGTGLTTAGAMNTLIAAVSQGHMTLNDLAGAVSNVLPATARFHISLIDTTGAIAEMTKQGDNASSAATHLRQMILALEAPSKIGAASMKEVGLSSQALAEEMKKSLPGAIQMVTDAVGKKFPEGSAEYNQAIKNIAGGSRQMMGFLELSGKHTKDFAEIVKVMAGDVKSGGSSIMGWAAVQGNFNFKMDQAKAAIQAMFIGIGQQLLPSLTRIVGAIVPLIVHFSQWIVQSHAVENVMKFLVTAITGVINVVGTMASFFQKNELAMVGLKSVLAAAAIIIGGVLVAALVAAAVAAWSFTVAMLANPVVWIVIAIAAAIAAIILVITHWGQIMTWLGGVFSWLGEHVHAILSAMGSFIGGIFSAIGTKIHDTLSGIGAFVGGVFSAIGTKIHDALLTAATFVYQKVTDIENFFKSLPGKIGQALANLGALLVAPFLWLYNHNYYVKAFVDSAINIFNQLKAQVGIIFSAIGLTIQNILTGTKNTVGAIFSAIGTFIHDRLVWIQNTVGAIFSAIGTFIHDRLVWIQNTVGSIFSIIGTIVRDKLTAAKNDAGAIFSAMGSLVQGKVTDLKNAVGNSFSALGSLMHQKLVDAWNGLVSFASGWPSQAFQWGVNLVQGLINGIGSMFSALGNAVSNLAGAITSRLGFHSPPKEGPAKDADTWMPNFVTMLAGGLVAGKSKMATALDSLIGPLATSASATLHLSATGQALGSSLLFPQARYSFPTGSGQTIVINVAPPDLYVDGQKMTNKQMPYIVNGIRAATGVKF